MHLVDLHVPTSRRSLELNLDLRSLAATQAKRTAASDLRHCTTGAGLNFRQHLWIKSYIIIKATRGFWRAPSYRYLAWISTFTCISPDELHHTILLKWPHGTQYHTSIMILKLKINKQIEHKTIRWICPEFIDVNYSWMFFTSSVQVHSITCIQTISIFAAASTVCTGWCTKKRTISFRCLKRVYQIHRQSPPPFVWRHHMHHTVVQNSSGRQVVWCRQTAALEQAAKMSTSTLNEYESWINEYSFIYACFTAVIWQSLPIQKTGENVTVCQGLGCGA